MTQVSFWHPLWELENRNELNEDLGRLKISLETPRLVKQKAKEYNSYLIPPDLPRTIKFAAFALMLSFVLELSGIFLLGRSTSYSIGGFEVPGSLISLIVGLFILIGKRWAKYALMVVWAFSTVFFVLFSTAEFDLFEVLQEIIVTSALGFILLKPSRTWYNHA